MQTLPAETDNRYKKIFEEMLNSLIQFNELSIEEFGKIYGKYDSFTFKSRDDKFYYDVLKYIPFYSGFRAATVEKAIPVIDKYFPDFITNAMLSEVNVKSIMEDKQMIRSASKINATIKNAKTFEGLVKEYGSFHTYLSGFEPQFSFENLMILKEDLQSRFEFLGGITVYHFMTDIGLNVLKPDRVVCRIFKRLGLIKNENAFLSTISQGRKFAEATGHSIRYVDILFVKYGQKGISDEFKIKDGICLEANPKCDKCGLVDYCLEYRKS